MIFSETQLKGVYLIDPENVRDERGFFARTFCQEEFKAHGLNPHIAQCSTSFNRKKGTLRGMHYQAAPYQEAKLVRCISGAIYDVALDVRPESPTFKRWVAVELSAENRKMLYIPEGCAHGFQALVDNTEVLYQISESYRPDSARGVRWDDPAFGIGWPNVDGRTISEKDRSYPNYAS